MLKHNDIQVAIQHFQAGNIEKSKKILDKYIVDNPLDVNAYLLSAAIKAAEADYPGVIDACEKILVIDPVSVRASYNAAVASEKLGKFQDVLHYASLVLQCQPAHIPASLLCIGSLYDTGDRLSSISEACQLILANKGNADISNNVFKIYSTRNDYSTARKVFECILDNDFSNMEALYKLAQLNILQRDYRNAEVYLNKLITINSEHFFTLQAKANLLCSLGKFTDCINYIESLSMELVANHPDLSLKLAEAYMGAHENNNALSIFNKSIVNKINIAECYHNIGIIEDRRGNVEEAISAYSMALQLEPASLSSNYNLAFLLDNHGEKRQALNLINNCLAINDSSKVRQAYVQILSTANIEHLSHADEEFILNIMSDIEVDAQTLSSLVMSLIRNKYHVIDKLVKLAFQKNYEKFSTVAKAEIKDLLNCTMLTLFYANLPINRYDFECFTKMLRKTLLLESSAEELIACDISSLCASIAIRNYISGYVITTEPEEKEIIDQMINALPNQHAVVIDQSICALGMYMPLYYLELKHGISLTNDGTNTMFATMEKLHIEDVKIENNLLSKINRISDISNETSIKVKWQYEGNPYPVWQKLDIRKPEPLSNILQSVSLSGEHTYLNSELPNILIAGCGTGSHAIQTAMRIEHRSMTAVDLSMRSLAFAQRKALEYDFSHIEFKQCDILNISELEVEYDVIESVGVLHHMQDPLAGLKSLVDILRPGGFMNIGLYSKLGRRHIIRAKSKYDVPDKTVTDDEIRKIRYDIFNSDDTELAENISGYPDFYTLHDCRDLIFNENENNYNIKEISELLDEAGLDFIGFDLYDKSILSKYRDMFPGDLSASIIKNWAIFEERYPDTFSSMYIFWCKKH